MQSCTMQLRRQAHFAKQQPRVPAALGRPARLSRPAMGPAAAAAALEAAAAPQASVIETLLATYPVPLVTEEVEQPCSFRPEDFHQVFSLGEVLGQGSYGTVRTCTHEPSGQQYAVKILSKRKANEERTEIIMREVRLWRMLSGSPHVTELFGAYQDANNIYIVQELLVGGDLQSVLDAQGVMEEQEAAAAMQGVLAALATCHAADICYGDVKPANFMLGAMYPSVAHMLDASKPKGPMQIKAIDFGCAQYCPDGCSLLQGLSGTPVYMAPEVITDHCHSISMDVWAAGVMLYQMLTGQFPFWDTNMAGLGRIHPRQILKDVQTAHVIMDIPACKTLSPDARDLLLRMLERDVSKRISAADALQHPWLQAQLCQQQI